MAAAGQVTRVGAAVFGLAGALWGAAAAEAGGGGPGGLGLEILGPAQPGVYGLIEFRLPADGAWANPYDSAEVAAGLEVRLPSGRVLTVPAFFLVAFEEFLVAFEEPSGAGNGPGPGWLYPAGPGEFRARFAPPEPGRYTVRASLRDGAGPRHSPEVSFEAVPSPRRGYLRVSRRDPRFFGFDDGTTFFPIGNNVAFVGRGQYMTPTKAADAFRRMAENGANYARVWVCCEDWALALESRQSAWGRSWAWKPPFAEAPDGTGPCLRLGAEARSVTVDPPHRVALKPGTGYRFALAVRTEGAATLVPVLAGKPLGDPVASPGAWRTVEVAMPASPDGWWLPKLELRCDGEGGAFVRGLSLRPQAGGPELLEAAAIPPVTRGRINPIDAWQLDGLLAVAERHGILLQLAVLTRDLYMKDMGDPASPAYRQAVRDAQRVLRYAVGRWGWSPNVAGWEYWNEMDPGRPTDAAYAAWGAYLRQTDPYGHLRSTSAWGPAPKDWTHPDLDFADLHWYLRPAWGELSKDAAAAVLDRAALLREHAPNRPALLGEFGLADDQWGVSPSMDRDRGWIHVHDALWCSALSGLSGTAQFWWWDKLDRGDAYPQYRGVAAFVRTVPFGDPALRRCEATLAGAPCRAVGLATGRGAWLWLQDSQATWWRIVEEGYEPGEVRGATLTLGGLAPGPVRVEWVETAAGRTLREERAEVGAEGLKLAVPPFRRDLACRVTSVAP